MAKTKLLRAAMYDNESNNIQQSGDATQTEKKRAPLWLVLAGDLLIAGLILLIFAYCQHGRAYLSGETVASLPAVITDAPSSVQPDASPCASPDASAQSADSEEVFTSGDVVQTDSSYKSANVNVSWERVQTEIADNNVVYYVVDIHVRSPEYLCTKLASGGYQDMETLAAESNAIVAINGDYSLARLQGVVVREGQLLRDSSFGDVLVMYADGSMAAFSDEDFDVDTEMAKGAENIWSFGPSLLYEDGNALTEYNTTVAGANPRTAIGYYEPCHYCFVVVDGRGEGGSSGVKMPELSKIFEQLGCKVAYNLDGGRSSILAWDIGGTILNSPYDGGRELGDIIYVPKI